MRAILQRVQQGRVTVDDKVIGEIDAGYVILLGITHGDNEAPFPSVCFTFHKQVEPEVMVGAIVHFVAPDPGAALD